MIRAFRNEAFRGSPLSSAESVRGQGESWRGIGLGRESSGGTAARSSYWPLGRDRSDASKKRGAPGRALKGRRSKPGPPASR